MIKPIWAAVGGVALLGTAGGIGVLVASSGGEEEIVQQVETATPTASASETPPSTTPVPSAAPTATPTTGQAKATLPGGFEFSYPSSWNKFVVSDGSPYIARFLLTATPRGEEDPGELDVWVYENPQNLALEEFFDGQERPNLFKDAAGGYRPYSTGGATGYWFDKVLGFETYTVVALSSDGFVYQFDDPQKHQTDGIFSQIVSSFKRAQG